VKGTERTRSDYGGRNEDNPRRVNESSLEGERVDG
jgi:hypothetical protein